MPQSIRPIRLNHMNAVLAEFDASVGHFENTYGAEFVLDIPQKEFHACLVEMGQVIFELFVPHDFLICARYGPHYLGVEFHADMDEVRAAVSDHGLRIARDIGVALHTLPADSFGVAFEFYGDYFHDRDWPLLGGKIKPPEYWRDDHPLGLTGLGGYTHAVTDLPAASRFMQSFLSAEPLYEEFRPAIAAQALGLRIADAVVELLAPVGDGPLLNHLHRHGEGIRSTVFGVRDLEQARRYFGERGLPLGPAAANEGFAIPGEANLGLIFEFREL